MSIFSLTPQSTMYKGYPHPARGIERQGDAGWGVQQKEPTWELVWNENHKIGSRPIDFNKRERIHAAAQKAIADFDRNKGGRR